jgi:hypothetical protein
MIGTVKVETVSTATLKGVVLMKMMNTTMNTMMKIVIAEEETRK